MAISKALHAIEYLAAPERHPPRPVCVVFGNDPFLKRQTLARLRRAVLPSGDAQFSFTVFSGPAVELRDVIEELATVAMFGGGKRLVLVEEADDLVTRYRGELEQYVAQPLGTGVLVLEVRSWAATTRLYKAVAAAGLQIDCTAPRGDELAGWLVSWAAQTHQLRLARPAAELLVEMVGPELGLLDQELAKLALTAGPGGRVTAETVGRSVGIWRAKTAWDMLDAALAGNAREALAQLDRLLLAGESPVGIHAQIAASLRRLAAATRLVLQAEASGRPIGLRPALERAGVKGFFLQKAEQQLRRLGRHRGAQLFRWLVEADLDLKGASRVSPQHILERLIVRLAAPEAREPVAGRPASTRSAQGS